MLFSEADNRVCGKKEGINESFFVDEETMYDNCLHFYLLRRKSSEEKIHIKIGISLNFRPFFRT